MASRASVRRAAQPLPEPGTWSSSFLLRRIFPGAVEPGTAPSSPGCRPPGLPSTQAPSTTDTCGRGSPQEAGALNQHRNSFRSPLPSTGTTLDVFTATIARAHPDRIAVWTAWTFTRQSVHTHLSHRSETMQQNSLSNSWLRRKRISRGWAPHGRRNRPNGPSRHDCWVWVQSGSRPAAELLAPVVQDNPFILQKPCPENGRLRRHAGHRGPSRPGGPLRVLQARLNFNVSGLACTPGILEIGSGGERAPARHDDEYRRRC